MSAAFVCITAVSAADLDRPPIDYSNGKPDNPVAVLQVAISAGRFTLDRDDEEGYLRAFLKKLDVPVSSQVLVFSRTSLQSARIGPQTPRAVYFNDDITVGFCVRGEVLEVAAADPSVGTAFYTVNQNPNERKRIVPQSDLCMQCHGFSNRGLPGHMLRSAYPDGSGDLILARGSKRIDHSTPLESRWGGWYVTGKSGKQTHLGNRRFSPFPGAEELDRSNITDLKPIFNTANYLSPHSDLVALMVLDHQCEGQNRIMHANFAVRTVLAEQAEGAKTFSDKTVQQIDKACEPLVEYLLFHKEAPLTEPIAGTSEFAKEFAARGPFDAKGRTLREFDLHTRVFRYPMSYLIYSQAFNGLPAQAKDRVYRRLWEVLTGRDDTRRFDHITAADRAAILEILRDTKTDLPGYWR